MQVPLQIAFQNIDPSPAIEAKVREHMDRLERFFPRITAAKVTIDAPHMRKQKGHAYQVRIVLQVPGKDIVVNRAGPQDPAHADFQVALRDAFTAARRQLEDYARNLRGEVKAHEEPNQGRVLRLFDDYGFIEDAAGLEVYFHRNAVVGGNFADLKAGDAVRLVIAEGEGEKGPQASTVAPIGR